MRSKRAVLHGVVVLLGITLLESCAISPLSKRTAAFSTAAVAATQSTTNAYQVVEQSYYESQVAALVVGFDKEGFRPESIQPFMAPKEMETRTRVLDGLKQYAETLAEVSGDKAMSGLDTQATAFGKSLQELSKNGELKPLAKSANISAEDLNIATTAVDALGRMLIEQRRRKDLPGVLKQMKDPVNQICTLLSADIGDPEKSGLRNELKNNYLTLIRKQEQFVHLNEGQMSAQEKRQEIERLPQMAVDAKRADQALAATQTALTQLAKTHTALVESGEAKDSPAFKTLLSELVENGQQLHQFYQKLPAK
jgi:hypothetical protein